MARGGFEALKRSAVCISRCQRQDSANLNQPGPATHRICSLDRRQIHGPAFHQGRRSLPRGSPRLCPGQLADRYSRQGTGPQACGKGRLRAVAPHPSCAWLGRPHLAEGMGRHGLERAAAPDFRDRDAAGWRPAHVAVRSHDDWPGADEVRQRRAQGALPATHPDRGRVLVSGLFRTRFRFGSRLAPDQRRAPWRQVHRQWPEDLDDDGAFRRLDLLPGAYRPGSQGPGRHLDAADRHEIARCDRATDQDARRRPRRERDLVRGGRGTGREPARRGTRAGPTPSTCLATSVPASPASGTATANCACSGSTPPRPPMAVVAA